MKYIVNVLIAAMLMHCSVAWSMLTKTLAQKKSIFAQKGIIEQAGKRNPMQILAPYSGYINSMMVHKNTTNPNAVRLPEVSQETVQDLAMIYSQAAKLYPQALQAILQNKSMRSLVDMIKLDDLLDMQPTVSQDILKRIAANKIKDEEFDQLGWVQDLTPAYDTGIAKEFIKQEKIDSRLLQYYSKFLITQQRDVPTQAAGVGCQSDSEYFGDKTGMMIYAIRCSQHLLPLLNPPSRVQRFLIKYADREHTIVLDTIIDMNPDNYSEYEDESRLNIISENGRFGVINYGQSNYFDSYHLVNLETFNLIEKLEDVAACCFYGDDTLCTVQEDGTICSFAQSNIDLKEVIAQCHIPINDKPHYITTNAAGTVIIVATKKDLYIVNRVESNDKIAKSFTIKDINTIESIQLNHAGSSFAIAGERYLREKVSPISRIYDIDMKNFKEISHTFKECCWTDDDAFLIGNNGDSINFIIVDSGNSWMIDQETSELFGVTISSDGERVVGKPIVSGVKFRNFRLVKLYDDVMKEVVNYFATNPDLLIVKLLDTILKYGKGPAFKLTDTVEDIVNKVQQDFEFKLGNLESIGRQIYEKSFPEAIKTVLERLPRKKDDVEQAKENVEQAEENKGSSTYPVGYGLGHTIYNLGREGLTRLYQKGKGTQPSE